MTTNLEHKPFYPLFLDLKCKPCLVVGAGAIGHQKVTALLNCGAAVTVTAIDVCHDVRALADAGEVRLNHRAYEDGEAAAYQVIIAATENALVNTRIHDDAHAANRLVNVVDVPSLCDFHVPAIVRRGRLQVAISTEGSSPTIAKRVKRDIDEMLSPKYDRLMDLLLEVRTILKTRCPDSLEDRMRINTDIGESPAVDEFLAGNETPLIEVIDHALAAYRNQP